MVNILITGGAGFIGSNFVHHMAKRYPDYRLVVLDSLTYAGSIDNLPPDMRALNHPTLRFWYGDVRNADLVNSLVADADYVVHFAAETHVTRSIFDNRLFFETDVIGTHTISNAVLKARDRIKRFVHVSTSEVYGTAQTPLMDEDHPLNPASPYASAKCGADRLVYSYCFTYNIPCTIVRPFNNFGPRQHLEKLIPRFVTSVLLGERLTVHGDGMAARDFVYVGDVCRAIEMLLHAEDEAVRGEAFNIATGQHRSIVEIAHDVLAAMGGNGQDIEMTSDRPGQVMRHTGDSSKIRQRIGWEPEVDWQEGLRRTIKWYTENRDWWDKQIWMRHIPITTPAGRHEYH